MAKVEAEKVSVVAASGSEREQVLVAQASESSEKVLELEKQLEESAQKLSRALKAGVDCGERGIVVEGGGGEQGEDDRWSGG